MSKPLRYGGQLLAYALFAAFIGYLSTAPAYSPISPSQSLIKLSLTHHGQLKSACRERSPEELAKLPPNMRAPLDCARERSPIFVELLVDGRVRYSQTLRPTGLSRDGSAYVYERFVIASGRHKLLVRMRDSSGSEGFDYVGEKDLDLRPGQIAVVDFDGQHGRFIFR